MPYEDFVDISIDLTEEDLDQLDRLAERAENDAKKIEKAQERAGGIYGKREGAALPKSSVKAQEEAALGRAAHASQIQKRRGQKLPGHSQAPFQRKTPFGELIEEQDALKKLFEQQFGTGKAAKAFGMMSNPAAFFQNFFTKTLPIIGAIITAKELTEAVMVKFTERGGPWDRFWRDEVSTRVNALIEREHSQEVVAGFRQEILTTQAGFISPADTFNTYNQDAATQKRVEENYSVRTKAGFD